jgi:hypothetical protein
MESMLVELEDDKQNVESCDGTVPGEGTASVLLTNQAGV